MVVCFAGKAAINTIHAAGKDDTKRDILIPVGIEVLNHLADQNFIDRERYSVILVFDKLIGDRLDGREELLHFITFGPADRLQTASRAALAADRSWIQSTLSVKKPQGAMPVAKDYNVSHVTVRDVVRAACKMHAGGGVANRNIVKS